MVSVVVVGGQWEHAACLEPGLPAGEERRGGGGGGRAGAVTYDK